MHLIQKGDSSSKHFSFFVFYFNVSNKISSTPPRLLNLQEFSNLPAYQVLKNFPTPRLFQSPLLLGTQEYVIMCFFKVCGYKNSRFFMVARISLCLISAAVTYKDYHSQFGQIKFLTYFGRSKQQLMRCFIQDLSLNVHSYLDLFLHGSSSSFDKQQRYHEPLGRKSASFIWCIKACMSLNGGTY